MPLTHRDLWDTRHLTSVLGARAMPEWQVFLYFLAITIASWFLSLVLPGQPEHVMRWSATALLSITNVLMFLRIGQHLKRLSRDASPIATLIHPNQ